MDGHVLLLDGAPAAAGIAVQEGVSGGFYLDFVVAGAPEGADFGVGDRVVLSDPNAGRKVRLDGVVHRVVRVSDVIGVVDI